MHKVELMEVLKCDGGVNIYVGRYDGQDDVDDNMVRVMSAKEVEGGYLRAGRENNTLEVDTVNLKEVESITCCFYGNVTLEFSNNSGLDVKAVDKKASTIICSRQVREIIEQAFSEEVRTVWYRGGKFICKNELIKAELDYITDNYCGSKNVLTHEMIEVLKEKVKRGHLILKC